MPVYPGAFGPTPSDAEDKTNVIILGGVDHPLRPGGIHPLTHQHFHTVTFATFSRRR